MYQKIAQRYLSSTYRLSERDKKVIKAFVMEREAEGKVLFSDGRTLEKAGILNSTFAQWINGKIHILSQEATKSDEVILRFLIKQAGKGMVRFNYERQEHPEPIFFYNKEISAFLHSGKPVVVYHGTTSDFKSFTAESMRTQLLEQEEFVGKGFFFSVSKKTATRYALSQRNGSVSYEEVFPLLKKHLPKEIYAFAEHVYRHDWDDKLNDILESKSKPRGLTISGYLDTFGVEINTLVDLLESIDGSKARQERINRNTLDQVFNALGGESDTSRDRVCLLLTELGIDSSPIEPRVLTCLVKADNVKLVRELAEAKRAQREGYDAIVWSGGEHLVNNEPEVVTFNPRNIQIIKSEVVS